MGLRPGIEQAKPEPSGAAQSLSLDPFAGAAPKPEEPNPRRHFAFSPLEFFGRKKADAMSGPGVPPQSLSSSAGDEAPAAVEAPASSSSPPRLDAESVALLQKLRASNAAAIEKMALSNAEAADEPVPQPEAIVEASTEPDKALVAESEPDAEAPAAAPFAELLRTVAKADAEQPPPLSRSTTQWRCSRLRPSWRPKALQLAKPLAPS